MEEPAGMKRDENIIINFSFLPRYEILNLTIWQTLVLIYILLISWIYGSFLEKEILGRAR